MRRAADLGRNRCHRRPARGVLARVIQNHPNRTAWISGENLFVVLLVMTPPSQELSLRQSRSGSRLKWGSIRYLEHAQLVI
jgi:hypothetical protein